MLSEVEEDCSGITGSLFGLTLLLGKGERGILGEAEQVFRVV